MKKALLFALLFILPACAYVDPSITDQTKVYYNSPVRKSPLQVSVHPKGKQYSPLTAYFHPFVVQQSTPDREELSGTFSQIFFNVWTEEQLFPTMEIGRDPRYRSFSSAMEIARRSGADLLIYGRVPYFYAGHTVDDTAITIQVDVYSTGSGQLLWTMMQSGRIEDKMPDDYIYFRHEYRLPESPFNKIIRDIAKDMSIPLKGWLPDPGAKFKTAQTTEEIKAGLTTPPTTMAGEPTGEDTESEVAPEADLPEEVVVRPQVKGVNLDIHFDFDKAIIKERSYPLLDALGDAMNSPELKGKTIIIGGHTDTKGNAAYNMTLSRKRADAVKSYLVQKGSVAPSTIQTIGYGQSRPLNQGRSEAEQQQNRRVEIRLAE